jgi:alpha-glucosidase
VSRTPLAHARAVDNAAADRRSLGSIHHDGSRRYVVPLEEADVDRLRIGDRVRLLVRAGLEAPVDRIVLRTTPDGEQVFEELREVEAGRAARWWELTLRIAMPMTGYRFLVITPDGHHWLNAAGLHVATPTDREDFQLLAGSGPPGALTRRVFYQIFPDRFANGDPSNDVRTGAWTYRGQTARARTWGEAPSDGPPAMVEFYGGDLPGIEAHLYHLTDLGVTAIYLTPIFDSRSNHGYDIVDYGRVADYYGGNEALVSLRRATLERDILLILDIAPNHTGVEHPWFRAAQADPSAPTAEYYVFGKHPDDYESWLGVGSLPKLDYRSQALREAMYEGRDSVLRHWLRPPFSIDGWRIDVANMLGRLGPDQLGPEVARGMRAAIKAENPDAYLLGEHSFDAIDQLAGDQWDAVMNYWGFTNPVVEWLAGVSIQSHTSGLILRTGRASTEAMVQTLTAFRSAISWSVARHQFNLLDSHDTARIASRVDGDRGRLRAALGFLLTYVGLPSILYGDEVGLDGADDLRARRTMPWDRSDWDLDHLAVVRTLIRFRVGSSALTEGGFQVLEIGEDHLAYLRDADDEWVIVVIVRGPTERRAGPLAVWQGAIPDGTEFTDLIGGTSHTVTGGMLPLAATPPGLAVWVAHPGRDDAR